MKNQSPSVVYVVSAPSGTGKTTLNRMLTEKYPHVEIAVSLTTRPKRPGEVAGRDYEYVTSEEFLQHVNRDEMLEWANVHGNLYGTSKAQLNSIEARGHIPLLEIDVQGWETARKKLRNAIAIFVMPPSIKSLWERLETRGTDSEATRWKRLLNAKTEIEKAGSYDFFIVNDSVNQAFQELEDIVIHGKPGRIDNRAGVELCRTLLEEFKNSTWITDGLRKHQNKI